MEERIAEEHARLMNLLHEYEHNLDYYNIDLNSIEWVKQKLEQLKNEPLNYFENANTTKTDS